MPPAFRGARAGNTSRELTNTTLGSIHLAACAAADRPHAQAGAEAQAETRPDGRRRASRTPGPLYLHLDAAVSQPLHCSRGNARGEGPFCANAAAAVGMRLTEERCKQQVTHAESYPNLSSPTPTLTSRFAHPSHTDACMLSTVSCGYYPAGLSAGAIPMPPDMRAALSDPSLIQIDMARFNLTFGGMRLSIVRDAVWGPMADLSAHQVDCTRLRPWSRAMEACELLVAARRGDVGGWLALDPSIRVATATALSRGICRETTTLVSMSPFPSPWRHPPPLPYTGKPENVFHYTNVRVEGASLPQAEVHGLLGQRAIEPRDHPQPAALGVEVSSSGEVSFGKQGEGAIEGSWEEYRVPRLEAHDGAFRYARFGCERGR